MESETLIQLDPILSAAAAVIAALWSVFKGSDWLAARRGRRFRTALAVVEAAADAVYQGYVLDAKARHPGQPLTPEERRRARQLARDRAAALALESGVDLARTLGPGQIDLAIAKAVKRLKAR